MSSEYLTNPSHMDIIEYLEGDPVHFGLSTTMDEDDEDIELVVEADDPAEPSDLDNSAENRIEDDGIEEMKGPQSSEFVGKAACKGMNANLFFPTSKSKVIPNAVAVVCSNCEVKVQCEEFALNNDLPGIWGGTNAADRRRKRLANNITANTKKNDSNTKLPN